MEIIKWNGKKINKPGFYSGIPLQTYHSAGICEGLALSSSNLRRCWSHSPAHMNAEWCENPKAEPRNATRPMILGSAAHHLLLGEDNFKTKYIAQPETYRDKKTAEEKKWNMNAHACQDWWMKQTEAGRIVVTVKELTSIVEMSRSLALDPLVKDGLLSGRVECSGFWKDKETGFWLKTRPDAIPMTGPDYVDLKTATEVTTIALMSAIREYGLHMQGALLWEVAEALGMPFETFTLMFIETQKPHCARAVPLTDDDLARGRLQNRAMLKTIRACVDAGHFPGPGEGDLQPLPLSNDERERIDKRLKFEGLIA